MSDRRRRIDAPGELGESAKRRAKALYPWRPGQSGNPLGRAIDMEARHLARQAAPAVMGELINLALNAQDERMRSVCCVAVLDRAYGRPREMPAEDQGLEAHFAKMTSDERIAYMESLLAPMREYLAGREAEEALPSPVPLRPAGSRQLLMAKMAIRIPRRGLV